MKRTIALLSLTLALTAMAFGQTARLNCQSPLLQDLLPERVRIVLHRWLRRLLQRQVS